MSGHIFIQDSEERIEVGELEVALAEPKHIHGRTLGLGTGIAWFRDGEYQGYVGLPDAMKGLPIADVVQTPEFQKIYRKLEQLPIQ